MPTVRLLPAVFALLAWVAGSSAPIMAQSPAPGTTPPATAKAPPAGDIAFYLVHGDADACGRGCNEWIAAEGKIDAGAATRLRRLLAKLGRRKPIVFFHSPGGQILGSIELGRLIREQKLTVSVGHTIPRGCERDKPSDQACEALKRSGQELAGELDLDVALCASACVYTLAGGTSRLVPPWVKLGIHDIGFDPDKKPPRGAMVAEVKRVLHDKLQDYLRDMGFDTLLLAAASAVPNESMKFLERNDIIRFGIDRREFGESAWYFTSQPMVILLKGFFIRGRNGEEPLYRNSFVSLSCLGAGVALGFGQEHTSEAKPAEPLAARIEVNGAPIELRYQTAAHDFDLRAGQVLGDALDDQGEDATIEISGIAWNEDGSARRIALDMNGFSAAYAKLRTACEGPIQGAMNALPRNSIYHSPDGAVDSATDAPAASASPPTIELARTAAANQRLRLDSIKPDCSIGPMTVSIVEQPQHGALTIENGQTILCNPNSALVFYRPSAGYTGADSITLKVAYPLGITTRHYAIDVR